MVKPCILGLVLCLQLSACGYQFTAGGPGPFLGDSSEAERLKTLQENAPRLLVLMMQNNSFETNLAQNYTEFLRREFQAGGGANVVSDPSAADLQLKSSIVSVTFPSITFFSVRRPRKAVPWSLSRRRWRTFGPDRWCGANGPHRLQNILSPTTCSSIKCSSVEQLNRRENILPATWPTGF